MCGGIDEDVSEDVEEGLGLVVEDLNEVQKSAYELIQSDARYLYTLTRISQEKCVDSNYMCMSLPYIGLFADGSEQWARKVELGAPQFNEYEKEFYSQLREGHKLFDKSYFDLSETLGEKLDESDKYYYENRTEFEKQIDYNHNTGTDFYKGKFCGNTILCATYLHVPIFEDNEFGEWLKNIFIIAGELARFYRCVEKPPFRYDKNIDVKPVDYHFFINTPLKRNDIFGLVLFSVLCSVNFIIEFIENLFIDEIPQKLKYAYLQYFYLCDFINDLNVQNGTNFYLDRHLYRKDFRNCLAHYGLGQFIEESELVPNDLLKGLTIKAFGKDYYEVKEELYGYLRSLTSQIELEILK